MILKIIENKDSFVSAFKESYQFLQSAINLLPELNKTEERNEILRHLHSVKGICSLYEISTITMAVHDVETEVSNALKNYPNAFPPDLKDKFSVSIKNLGNIFTNFCEEISPIVGEGILSESPRKRS